MRYKFLIVLSIVALVLVLCGPTAGFAYSILGTADNFAVLGASTVTNTGSSVITGNLGVYAGTATTGFASTNTFVGSGSNTLGPGLVSEKIHLGDSVAQQAQIDATTAYLGLKAMPVTQNLTGTDLGGLVLNPGVYRFDSSAQLTGILTLDADHDDNAFWVFQIESTLITAATGPSAPHSKVQLINPGSNDGRDDGVFWQVGSSATLGTYTEFEGNILALADITLTTGATNPNGRFFAQTGAVTLDTNTISNVCPNGGPGYNGGLEFVNGRVVPIDSSVVIPEPSTMLLFGLGGAITAFIRKRRNA